MRDGLIPKKKADREREIVLRLLERVAEDDKLSQDRFAKQIGIAKGLANAYFRRCLQKGWIKHRQVPRRRYLYYLTPTGCAEKARLTTQFLSHSYQFYRDARADLVATMVTAAYHGHSRLGVLGDGEMAEIAAIVSDDAPIELVGFFAPDSTRTHIARRPVTGEWSSLDAPEAALLATVEDAKPVFVRFRSRHPDVAIHVPTQLAGLVWDQQK